MNFRVKQIITMACTPFRRQLGVLMEPEGGRRKFTRFSNADLDRGEQAAGSQARKPACQAGTALKGWGSKPEVLILLSGEPHGCRVRVQSVGAAIRSA